MRTVLGLLTATLLATACGDDGDGGGGDACTDIAIIIPLEVIAPDDLVIDRVTVQNAEEVECTRDDGESGPRTGSGGYNCHEQAGGAYDFVVYSGEDRWTQSAVFDYDGCHLVDPQEVVFDITGQ